MTRAVRRVLAALLGGALSACSNAPSKPASRDLPEGVVARVGSEVVTAKAVADVARAQGRDAVGARDLLVRDALFASGARAAGVDAAFETDAALARRVLAEIQSTAERGPVTDEELLEATKKHWYDVDRPEAFQTTHAFLVLDEKADDEKRERARLLLEAVREKALALGDVAKTPPPATSIADGPRADPLAKAFEDAARSVPASGLELQIQQIPPVSAKGAEVLPKSDPSVEAYFSEFAAAAAALSERGAVSPVTKSRAALHVILLLERTPAIAFPEEERRARLRPAIVVARAQKLEKELLAKLWKTGPEIDGHVDTLLAQIPVEP